MQSYILTITVLCQGPSCIHAITRKACSASRMQQQSISARGFHNTLNHQGSGSHLETTPGPLGCYHSGYRLDIAETVSLESVSSKLKGTAEEPHRLETLQFNFSHYILRVLSPYKRTQLILANRNCLARVPATACLEDARRPVNTEQLDAIKNNVRMPEHYACKRKLLGRGILREKEQNNPCGHASHNYPARVRIWEQPFLRANLLLCLLTYPCA